MELQRIKVQYIRYRIYRSAEEELSVIKAFEFEERIQGTLNIFTTASEIQRRYRKNAGSYQLSLPTRLIEETKSSLLPIEAVIYSRYHIEIKVYGENLKITVFLVKLSRFFYTNLWKIFLISNKKRKQQKRRRR
mgnify:FL=1